MGSLTVGTLGDGVCTWLALYSTGGTLVAGCLMALGADAAGGIFPAPGC